MSNVQIVIEQNEEGQVRLKVENVQNEKHAVWLLSTAISSIVAGDEEEVTADEVQELPSTDENKE